MGIADSQLSDRSATIPSLGHCTQEDPIGLAGGLNLYGYGDGDPVNNADPFGLCTPFPECVAQSLADWGASRGGRLGSVALNSGAILNAAFEATGMNVAGQAGADLRRGDVASASINLAMALPAGRSGRVASLMRDAADNPGNWKVVGSFVEAATNRRAKGGASIQTILENASGDRLVQHTVVSRTGKVLDDHLRPMFKP